MKLFNNNSDNNRNNDVSYRNYYSFHNYISYSIPNLNSLLKNWTIKVINSGIHICYLRKFKNFN